MNHTLCKLTSLQLDWLKVGLLANCSVTIFIS